MESLTSILGSNLLSETDSAQQKAYVTYAFPRRSADGTVNDNSVTLLESRSVISSSGTTGLRTWEAALLLGQFLSSEVGRPLVQKKRVFELGAGTGMLSILCAKHLDVAGVVSTDGDEAVVDAIKTNVFLNELDASQTVNTAALKWGRPVDGSTFLEDYGMDVPEVLLGADVVRPLSACSPTPLNQQSTADIRLHHYSGIGFVDEGLFRPERGSASSGRCNHTQ